MKRAAAKSTGSRRSRAKLYSPKTTEYAPIEVKIYVQDPLATAGRPGGLTRIRLDGEAFLGPGPTSSRIRVLDVDEEGRRVHEPVWPRQRGGFAVGRGAPVANFKHHQVNVWATVTRMLNILEDPSVFGRRIPWAFPGGRLGLLPHAIEEDNAYYDRETGDIRFGWFEGARGPVYTCLSHDTITHELGHAVLDGLKPLYNEIDSPEVDGFHEYFGDALAMVSALTMREVVTHVVRRPRRRLEARNMISDIALEFGSAGRGDEPLRSAANRRTMRGLQWVAHDDSEILTGAFYDLLCALYADDFRRRPPRSRALGHRQEAAVASLVGSAHRTTRMLLRALDYCPPVGLTYREYARAALRADKVAYPIDERGYRRKLFGVFRRRGILTTPKSALPGIPITNADLREFDIDQVAATRTDAYRFIDANREALRIPRDVNFEVCSLYRTRKMSAARYFPPREIITEFRWTEPVELRGKAFKDADGATQPLWCGGTLVFDTNSNVLHYTATLPTERRKKLLRDYLRFQIESEDENAAKRRFRLESTPRGARYVRRSGMRHAGRSRFRRGR